MGAHETKIEAVRRALEEQRDRLATAPLRHQRLTSFLEKQIWSFTPEEVLGKKLAREEEDRFSATGRTDLNSWL